MVFQTENTDVQALSWLSCRKVSMTDPVWDLPGREVGAKPRWDFILSHWRLLRGAVGGREGCDMIGF